MPPEDIGSIAGKSERSGRARVQLQPRNDCQDTRAFAHTYRLVRR